LSTVPASGWLKRLTEAVAGNPANAGLGLTFDLPTEAQWEYACRAGTTGTYNDSDDIALTAEAAAARIFTLGWFASNDSPDGAKEVGLKKANRAGLYDMHGNVWEFCRDTWSGNTGLPGGDDPLSSGTDSVFRGGYWGSTSQFCRSAYRYRWRLADADVSIGFRVIAVGP
jgi:formylglycine-generating enzyme required for sulfatase activity